MLLIAPVGIEIQAYKSEKRSCNDLLIAPVGIEIKHADRLHRRQCLLLIAPVGIEIKLFYIPLYLNYTFNRTSRN